MSRNRVNRWRDSRSTLPAARRRRRHHRRDIKRGGTYYPVDFGIAVAQEGVRNRLGWGITAITIATFTLLIATTLAMSHFALVAFATFGFCSMCAGFALVASARREESVHRLASELCPRLEHDSGADGSI